jgi:LysR family transcriptional regulator, hydrogen peroxide-inducible genes activator
MEIHQLRYFCAAAETGSFTRGARRERVTQPTLSQQLLKLENELGAKLFDRRQHPVRLTTSGRTLLRSAKAILSQLDELKQEIRKSSKEQAGSVAVGSTPTLTQHLLSPIVRKFTRSHPSIKVQMIEDLQVRLLPALRAGLLDLALVHLPVAGREFRTEKVMQQSLYVALPKSHALAGYKQIRLAQLRHNPFLLLRETLRFGTIVREALRKAQIDPDVVFESSSIDNILAMVSAGAGISLVPEMAVVKRGPCRFVPVEDSRRTGIGWVMLKHYTLSPAQRLFIETVAHGRSVHHNNGALA